jgi:hypothetical protein
MGAISPPFVAVTGMVTHRLPAGQFDKRVIVADRSEVRIVVPEPTKLVLEGDFLAEVVQFSASAF